MMEKFKSCDFGRCPRVYCNGQACLPVGLSGAHGDGWGCLWRCGRTAQGSDTVVTLPARLTCW